MILLLCRDALSSAISTLSLHDALPICDARPAPVAHVRLDDHRVELGPNDGAGRTHLEASGLDAVLAHVAHHQPALRPSRDRKSTRLNSSHRTNSYAVFCLKKKKNNYPP